MVPSLASWIDDAAPALRDVADNPRSEVRRLVEAVTGLSPVNQIADPDVALTPEQAQALQALLTRRVAGEPLARILGQREFWGLSLLTQGVTLDPRADTETLIEQALALRSALPPSRVLDLGTGSGALLLALLTEFPDATGLGVDQSRATLATAEENAARLGLSERAAFAVTDWFEGIDGHFDLIISNPPYIPTADLKSLEPAVRDFDAPEALDGGADGLRFYRSTLAQAADFLQPGGLLILELGQGQSAAVTEIGAAHGWRLVDQRKDLAGIVRALAFTRDG